MLQPEMVSREEEESLGGKNKEFRFGHMKFQVVMAQPSRNVRQAVRGAELSGQGKNSGVER